MIRYFLQGKFGPWYEVTEEQWAQFRLTPLHEPAYGEVVFVPHLRAVYVNTELALQADIKEDFGDLADLIWWPDMRCGDCGGRLVDANRDRPDKKYPSYTHASMMLDRHGAYPVERWED